MPNKTIYVRDEDLPDWEWAQQLSALSGEKISAYLLALIRKDRAARDPGGTLIAKVRIAQKKVKDLLNQGLEEKEL